MPLLLAATGLAAPPSQTAELEAQFQKIYQEYALAIQNRDSIKFLSFLGSSFKMISADGTERDRAEMIERHKQNMKTTTQVHSFAARIESLTKLPNGDVAVIVVQRYNRDQVATDEPTKPRNIKTATVQRDTWHQELTGWRLEKIEELLSGPIILDGKPVAP